MRRFRDTETGQWGFDNQMDEVLVSDQPKRLMAFPVTSPTNGTTIPLYTAADLSYQNSVSSYASSRSTDSRSSLHSRASSTTSSRQSFHSAPDQHRPSSITYQSPNAYDNDQEPLRLKQSSDSVETIRLSLQQVGINQPIKPSSWQPFPTQTVHAHPPKTQPHFVIAAFGHTKHGKHDTMRLFFRDKVDASQGNQLRERTRLWRVHDKMATLTTIQMPDELLEENQYMENTNYLNGLLGNRLGITTILAITSVESRLNSIFELLDSILMTLPGNSRTTNWWDRLVLVFNQGENRLERVMQQRESMIKYILPDIQRRYALPHAPSIMFISTRTYKDMERRSRFSAEEYENSCRQILWRIVSGHSMQGWCRGDAVLSSESENNHAMTRTDSSDDDDMNDMFVILARKKDKPHTVSVQRSFTKKWIPTPSRHGP
ncbi:hypothetical protein EC973_008715 [Apophysomyces ossiformis]|uniref:Uncharacterized protein n=1 Tax=Apophysomyces ossiformis TaxID=679940 RepID=A0A8H7BSZ3_9FUNG|nr:hypothetical protein EC973_008715 [Apophysomyces ossiformis]